MKKRVLLLLAILLIFGLPQVTEATNATRVTAYHDGTVYVKDGSSLGWMANDTYYNSRPVPVHNDFYLPNAPGDPWNTYGGTGWNRQWVRLTHAWSGSSVHVDTYRATHGTSQLTYSGGRWYFTTAATGALRTYRRAVRVNYEKYLPPGQPTSITYPAVVDRGQNITVSWPTVSTSDRYRLEVQYRKADGTTTVWELVATLTGTSRNAAVAMNSSFRDVRFRVRADNQQTKVGPVCGQSYPTGGVSSYRTGSWTPIRLAPTTPGAFTAPQAEYLRGGTTVNISWGQTSFWGHPQTTRNYRLQSSFNGDTYTDIAATGTTASATYNIPSSANNATVRFRVRAESGGGNSGWVYSNTFRIDTEPPVITANPSSRDWDKTDVTVSLNFNDNGSGLLWQRFAWSDNTSTPFTGWSGWGVSTSRIAGPVGNGIWYLHVQAEDRVGNAAQKYFGPYKVIKISLDDIVVDDVLFGDGALDNIPIYAKAGSVVFFRTRYSGDVENTWAVIDGETVSLTPQENSYKGEFRVPLDAPVGTVYPVTVHAESYGHSFSFHEDEFIIVVGSIWENVRLRFIK